MALRAAKETGCEVLLISAPGAAAYLGGAVFRELLEEAHAAEPEAKFQGILDCADDAGIAMNAVRQGVKQIAFHATPEINKKIDAICKQAKALRVDLPTAPHDLNGAKTTLEKCISWIKNEFKS